MKNVGTQVFGLGMAGGATPGLFDGRAESGPGAENGGNSCLEGDVGINGGVCVSVGDVHGTRVVVVWQLVACGVICKLLRRRAGGIPPKQRKDKNKPPTDDDASSSVTLHPSTA